MLIIFNKWIWRRPELLALNASKTTNNKYTIVDNFHQDFVASMHSDFFLSRPDMGLLYWPNYSWETCVLKQE